MDDFSDLLKSLTDPAARRSARKPVAISKSEPFPIYGEAERKKLRAAGRFNGQLMDHLRPHVKAGVTTDELDQLAYRFTVDHGHVPACLGYKGYPKTICTSINEVICHGIPSGRVLVEGDIVNVDITTIVDGWYGDQSETFLIGNVSEEAQQLVQTTFESLYVGIRAIKPFGTVRDIGTAIYTYATERGLGVVRDYQGHGIGQEFHQDPGIPHYPHRSGGRDVIKPGMCFTIEPMLNLGDYRTVLDKSDKWTVRTKDGKLSAQFEHTILMTEAGPEILTLTEHGPREGDMISSS